MTLVKHARPRFYCSAVKEGETNPNYTENAVLASWTRTEVLAWNAAWCMYKAKALAVNALVVIRREVSVHHTSQSRPHPGGED